MKIKDSKILVTGGAGFVGSNLVDRLVDLGNDVVIIDDLSNGKEDYLNPSAKFYKTDICSEEIDGIFRTEKPDIVFHLAAQIDLIKSIQDPIFDNRINVEGSLNIFQNSIKSGVQKVVYFSSGGAISGETKQAADEKIPLNASAPYGIHKYTSEKNLEVLADLNGLDYVIVRPSNLYGQRQYKGGECGVIGIFLANLLEDKESIIYGDGLQARDFIHIDDVVNFCLKAINASIKGIYNVSFGREINILDLIKAIEKATGKEFKYHREEARKGDVVRNVLDNHKAEKDLGWRPEISLEEGIKRTINWFDKANL